MPPIDKSAPIRLLPLPGVCHDQVRAGTGPQGSISASLRTRYREGRQCMLEQIIGALAHGDRVELRGFGAFSARRREARNGRNPRTGAAVFVSAKALPFFRTGKELRKRLNRSENDMPEGP